LPYFPGGLELGRKFAVVIGCVTSQHRIYDSNPSRFRYLPQYLPQ
jgi:hypothetical protein